MQWVYEDALLLALGVLEADTAKRQMERDAVSDAEQRVLERVRAERG